MKKHTFYLLSFTWGLPLTLIGLVVALVLLCLGKKPKKWGWCYCFEIGRYWGGLELGIIFITDKDSSDHTRNHEHGHAIQNCRYGFLMPFIVCIPSAIRYWYREISGNTKTPYDAIWFEGEATRLGTDLIGRIGVDGNG